MITALALILVAPLQIPDFSPRLSRAPFVIAELSKITGTKLEAGDRIVDEVVFVSVQNRTGKEIMDQLAYALEATWSQDGDKYVLNRPANWDEVVKERRIAAFKESFDASIKEVAPAAETGLDELVAQAKKEREDRNRTERMGTAEVTKFSLKTPLGNLLDSIVAELGPDKIARAAVDGRVVFSKNPTKVQLPFPPKILSSLEGFIKRHNELVEKMLPTIPAEQPNFGENAYDSWAPINAESMKLLLVVSRTQREMTLTAYQDNRPAGIAHRALRELAPHRPSTNVAKVPLTERSLTFLKKRTENQFNLPTLTDPKTLTEFGKATENDFLEYVNAEAMAAIQKRDGMPMIAVIPDQFMPGPWMLDAQDNLALNFYESSFRFFGLSKKEHSGWQVIRPDAPPMRISRTGFEKSLARIRQDGRFTLQHWADLMVADRSEHAQFIGNLLFLAGKGPEVQWMQYPGLVRFFGSLTKEQRETVKGGAEIPAEQFSDDQRNLLGMDIYLRGMSGYTRNRQSPGPGEGVFNQEPTEIFSNGMAAPVKIQADVKEGQHWFMTHDQGRIIRAVPDLVAWFMVQSERLDLFPGTKPTSNKDRKFYQGALSEWNFTIMSGAPFDLVGSLADEVPEMSKPFTFEQLPAEFKEAVSVAKKALIARYEKLKAEGLLGNGKSGGGPPPPPR